MSGEVAPWSPVELRAARAALGLSVNGLAAALVSPFTGRPWKASRVSECESGGRKVPDWLPGQVAALERARDDMAGRMAEAMEADPDGCLIVHTTDAGLWAAHPDMCGRRIPAAVQRVAAALAAAEIEAATGVRPGLVDADSLPRREVAEA